MKKVSLLILLVIVLSTMLTAAVPTKMLRLYVINKSDFDVFIKLTGSEVTDAFYYLTIPTGSADNPTVKVFTVLSDVYDRETWACNGVRSAGILIMSSNTRLVFTPCGKMSACTYLSSRWNLDCVTRHRDVYLAWAEDNCDDPTARACLQAYVETVGVEVLFRHREAGEPTMEKVAYFRYLQTGYPSWSVAELYGGYFNLGCATWYWRSRTYSTPLGCAWRYQY